MMAVEQGLVYEAAWDFAERWVSRWNAHDVEGILALVSEDVIWDDPPGFAPTGHAFQLEGVDLWKLQPADGVLCQVASHYDALEFARRVDLMPARGSLAERMLVRLQRVRERARR